MSFLLHELLLQPASEGRLCAVLNTYVRLLVGIYLPAVAGQAQGWNSPL